MSKKSISDLNIVPFKKYFYEVIIARALPPNMRESAYSLCLIATIPLPHKNGSARVEILLGRSDDRSFLAVVEFNVNSTTYVLSGKDLLSHYGKRQVDKNEDLSKPDNNHFWIMTRAADLQALLVAYDNLAKEWGKPALFGH